MNMFHHFKARSVLACWTIARRDAEVYQRRMNKIGRRNTEWLQCKAARDAASHIAMKIRYGRRAK